MKAKLKGIAVYPKLRKPDDLSGRYQLDFIPDEASKKILEEQGVHPAKDRMGNVKVHASYPGQPVYKIGRNAVLKNGTVMDPPAVYDSAGNVVPDTVHVGTGSTVVLYGKFADATYMKTTIRKFYLNTVQVVELVELKKVDKIDGGFVVGGYMDSDDDGEF